MTQQNLQQTYSRQNWQTWLTDIFGSQMQFETQAETIDIDCDNIKSIQRFASVNLADGKKLAVFDIETHIGVQIARNRVGLRKLVDKYIDHDRYHGILAFYYCKDAACHVSTGEYRMSFISSEPKIDADGNFLIEQTEPKRYTYVLGENEKTKTPADRLKIIAGKNGKASLEDVKNAFSVETLTKEFYKELSDWYFWALQNVEFPNDLGQDEEINKSTSVIRLITRLMFVWFLKQKKLIADELFETEELEKMLNYNDKTGSTFYKAILQNLFFATLNTEMGEKRKFVNRQSGIQGFYRYERFFKNKERFIELTKDKTPFLNGGLFESLDKNVGEENEMRIDCFSNRIDKEKLLKVPDFLFFGEEKQIDLNKIYDTRGKTYKVRGLIDILKTYNFTIEENTPTDIEVALDPELLGKVFENLLASFNPETQTTARKQTGSFYTPREIVDYMVNESLKAYLSEPRFSQDSKDFQDYNTTIEMLFSGNPVNLENLNKIVVQTIIQTLNEIKILDPACGSGAFPMGILQKMVQILQTLDPDNTHWREVQKQKAIKETEQAYNIGDKEERQKRLLDIDEAFDNNASDYGRKLFLIENCIFGVDIQPIAVQISKLRFFISLICEQTPDNSKQNLGIRPLPNLETKFVAANSLIGLNKPQQGVLGMSEIEPLEKELAQVRHKHFSARTPETKRKYREKDDELRHKIAKKLKEIGYANDTAEKIAQWNPYDQNIYAEWFDIEWMFDVKEGFDIMIGNPPYVNVKNDKIYSNFKTFQCFELYAYFFEKGIELLKQKGVISFITGSLYIKGVKFQPLRKYLTTNTTLLHLINEGDKIFENVKMPTSVFIGKKDINVNWKLEDINVEFSLLKKMEDNTVSISQIAKIMRGLEFGRDRINDIDEIPFISGSNICKYGITKMSYIDKKTLNEFEKEKLFFEDERILMRETGSTITALYLDSLLYSNRSLFSILITNKNFDTKFVLGCLNSKVLQFYYQTKFKAETELFPKIRIVQAKELPIPTVDKTKQQPIATLVNQIIYLKNTNNSPVSKIVNNEIIASRFEKMIDACVYELYFEEEIKSAQVDVLELIQKAQDKVSSLPIEQQILHLFEEWNDYKNEVCNRIILQKIKSESVAQIVKSANS